MTLPSQWHYSCDDDDDDDDDEDDDHGANNCDYCNFKCHCHYPCTLTRTLALVLSLALALPIHTAITLVISCYNDCFSCEAASSVGFTKKFGGFTTPGGATMSHQDCAKGLAWFRAWALRQRVLGHGHDRGMQASHLGEIYTESFWHQGFAEPQSSL